MKTAIALLLAISCAGAAGIDGKWSVEVMQRSKKAAQAKSVGMIFELKASGGQLTGSVTAMQGRRPRPVPIVNGKLDGQHFTFTTVQNNRKKGGSTTLEWEGTVNGDEITGTRARSGARRGADFNGKRQS